MNIVIAVDGSPSSKQAAAFFAKLSHRGTLSITILSVINVPLVSGSSAHALWYPTYARQHRELSDRACQEVERYFDGVDASIKRHVCEGHAAGEILKCAEAEKADLIVLGAQGHSSLNRILLGSISDHVATHAKCSVLVVRPGQERLTNEELKITVGCDGSDAADAAIEQLLEFQWGGSVRVQALSVAFIPPLIGEGMLPLTIVESKAVFAESQALAQTAANKLAKMSDNVEPTVIESTHIGHAMVEAAGKFGSQLTVVGNSGMSALESMLLGSVSRYVLRHSDGSVWIARRR